MRKFFLSFITGILLSASSFALVIGWDANKDAATVGYNFYYGTTNQPFLNRTDVGNNTNVVLNNSLFTSNVLYSFTAVGYNFLGFEGNPSIPYLWRKGLNSSDVALNIKATGKNVKISWNAYATFFYELQTTTSLSSNSIWTVLATYRYSTNTVASYTDSVTKNAQTFYRVYSTP